jgi:hypothetical protein
MKKTFHFTFVVLCTLAPCVAIFAQLPPTGDTAKPVELFYNTVNESAHLFNGTEYIMYDQHIKGDPYFMPSVSPGSVFYDGTLYTNVPMLYETTTGKVVVRQYNNGLLINLINERVDYFFLNNHTFFHIVPDSNNTVITNGFYDRIYNGSKAKVTLFAKRQKLLYEDPSTYERSFKLTDRYYLLKDNVWHAIHSQGDVLALFKDKKKDIAKYLRQNKIKFKKGPEYAMVKMAEYYDSLTH